LTSLTGAMLNINTYDQPGVELGKTILYANLNK
jgi:glucose-6-phosphate isomerase